MVTLVRARPLDFGDVLPETARTAIKETLADEPRATRKVYAALARKVWSLLIERRLDEEIRDWHGLLHGVKARVRKEDPAAAERVTALADLLRESISLAETSPASAVAARPKARRILEILNKEGDFVPRRVLKDTLEIGTSHLSNVLTQLAAHNLIDRRDKGKEAEFRLTVLGRQILTGDTPRPVAESVEGAFEKRLFELLAAEQPSKPPIWPANLAQQWVLFPTRRDRRAEPGPIIYGSLFDPADDDKGWLVTELASARFGHRFLLDRSGVKR